MPSPTRDWGAEGVFWTGEPGHEIQRLDDMSDYERTEPPFDGDIDAARHVARNGFPFLVYVDVRTPGVDDHWTVTAFERENEATLFRDEAASGAVAHGATRIVAFCFDGRTQEPVSNAAEDGYYPPGHPVECVHEGHEELVSSSSWCAGCSDVPHHFGDFATHRVTITGPPAAAEANPPELVCLGCAAGLAKGYVGMELDVTVVNEYRRET